MLNTRKILNRVLFHIVLNTSIILIVYKFYRDFEFNNYRCGPYTHSFGFIYPIVVSLYLFFSSNRGELKFILLRLLSYILTYSMFWFHFLYELENRGILN